MSRNPLLLVTLFFIQCSLLPSALSACGYSFVSGCATSIKLFVNGTPIEFRVADCYSYGIPFNNMQIGSIQSLALSGANALTWESCQNNVSKMTLQYRLFREGDIGGEWTNADLNLDSARFDNPYTARFFGLNAGVNLLDGFFPGLKYVMEVRYRAEVDTIGDDNVPETFMLQNNDGQNYRLSFRYDGGAAPSFWAFASNVRPPTCADKSNGTISVTAYGKIVGMTYNWSNGVNNSADLYNLKPGTYTVTLSNALGTVQIISVNLYPPPPLHVAASFVKPTSCPGGGQAIIKAGGGMPPYQYQWATGSSAAVTSISTPGNWPFIITDGFQCQFFGSVDVPSAGPIKEFVEALLCDGEVYKRGFNVFSQSGNYDFAQAGINGACDTSINLSLKFADVQRLLDSIPSTYNFSTCAKLQSDERCAGTSLLPTDYIWKKGNDLAGTSKCFTGLGSNTYTLQIIQKGDRGACIAQKSIDFVAKQTGFSASINGIVEPEYCNPYGPVDVILNAATNAQDPTYTWIYEGNTISTSPTCNFTITKWQPPHPILPTLTVKDNGGCESKASNNLIVFQPPIYNADLEIKNASKPNVPDGRLFAKVGGGVEPYLIKWEDGTIGPELSNVLPGKYCMTVTDGGNCTRSNCAEVKVISPTKQPNESNLFAISPNPVQNGAIVTVESDAQIFHNNWQMEILDARGTAFIGSFFEKTDKGWKIPITSDFAVGTYFVRLQNETQQIIKPLIIVK